MLSLFVFHTLSLGVAGKVKGSVPLDSLTFDKIIDGSLDVFVKFDKEYA